MSFLFFKSFADLVKGETIRTDNGWFVLHYRVSVILMAVSSVLIGTTQYFGDPINCEVNNFDKSMVNTYCWTHGTWTVAEFLTKEMQGKVAHPGVGPYDHKHHTMVHHGYYQWVPIVIALSALMFYVPRYLWKMFEGGWIANMCKDMKYPSHNTDEHSRRVKILYQFYIKNHRKHRTYGFMFAFCEFLNLLNVIIQWIMADVFMRGRFHDYGSNALYYFRFQSDVPDVFNPCDLVFPKMAKCSFKFYGGSGDESIAEPLCILPQNILNEKIALIVWFWFILLIGCSTLAVMIRMVVMMVPVTRKLVSQGFFKLFLFHSFMLSLAGLSFFHAGPFYFSTRRTTTRMRCPWCVTTADMEIGSFCAKWRKTWMPSHLPPWFRFCPKTRRSSCWTSQTWTLKHRNPPNCNISTLWKGTNRPCSTLK